MAVTTTKVLLYYPNLIGYVRFICMAFSFLLAEVSWHQSIGLYLLAFVGDVVDGYVARAFHQSSKYGGVLDMVTDRVSTCGLLIIISHFYPRYKLACIFLVVLDITSHWFHVMSVSAHHKSKEALKNRSALLQWYYSIYPLFGYCCVGTEAFFILLYVTHPNHFPHPLLIQICFYGCLPACILKQLVNVVQLISAATVMATVDAEEANEAAKGNKAY